MLEWHIRSRLSYKERSGTGERPHKTAVRLCLSHSAEAGLRCPSWGLAPLRHTGCSSQIAWRLKKAMYGLRSAPASWQLHFRSLLQEWGFTQLKTDSCLFVNASKNLWVLVWVDDLLIASSSASAIAKFKKGIESKLLCKDLGVLEAGGTSKCFIWESLRTSGHPYYNGSAFKLCQGYSSVDGYDLM